MKKEIYYKFRNLIDKIENKRGIDGNFFVINRGRNCENLLYILAGYKPELWKNIFERIRKEDLDDFDVCIISSGIYSQKLEKIAQHNKWSYIYSKQNRISNIQNKAITCFPKARTIWKLDEDMFICKGYFEIMKATKIKAEKELEYDIGFLGPLIPINNYGYVRFLKYCNKLQEYEQRFGVAKVGFNERKAINLHSFFEANKYLWEITGNIDTKAKEFNQGKLKYSICAGRFSIGAIMFDRELWEDMGGFKRDRYPCDGRDEEEITSYCVLRSKAMVVAEDALVGHYCFGGFYTNMNKFMKDNKYRFLKEEE
ncbi:MAG: hypothetical protein HFG50_02700 [Lachnospiraceae bacterium]|nr:hypothetical protein [Lachnospiraceae bacterium]